MPARESRLAASAGPALRNQAAGCRVLCEMRRSPLALAAACASLPSIAHAFVGTPVAGQPGELDVNAVVTAERSKTEPNENPASATMPARRRCTSWGCGG